MQNVGMVICALNPSNFYVKSWARSSSCITYKYCFGGTDKEDQCYQPLEISLVGIKYLVMLFRTKSLMLQAVFDLGYPMMCTILLQTK